MSSGLRISSSIGVNPLGAEPRPKNATIQLLEGYGDDDQRTEMATLAPFVADTAGTDEGGTVNTAHKNWTLEVNTPVIYERKMTVSRKLRHDSFIAWFKDKKTQQTIAKNIEKKKANTATPEELMSAKDLIMSSTKEIISRPREYQLEIFEIAKRNNIIAVLNTGSGKTLISCLLIRHMIGEELEARKKGARRRVCFFIVDSVTLVFQQSAVLGCNIDAKVGKFYGRLVDGLWSKTAWTKILNEHEVIVLTADVLHNCLTHAFISMKDMNLMCFDEAHRAKKDHVYARIIRDFYVHEAPEDRPKVFGMTASPVDARVDVVAAAKELENMLHCRIATTSDLSLMQQIISTPRELVLSYTINKDPNQPYPPLYKKMKELYGSIRAFRKVFAFADTARVELGAWCADYVWTFTLTELESQKLERRVEKESSKQVTPEELAKLDQEILKIREAQQIVTEYEFPEPRLCDISQKVQRLTAYLRSTYKKPTSQKCLVFVTQRNTARVLHALLEKIGTAFMRLGILIGSQKETGPHFSLRQQMLNVVRFKNGKLNCLIATAVAEEGLDIPDCNLIIRFDLYHTMIQYIQSRGRARHSESLFIHMVDSTNQDQLATLQDVKIAEATMKEFCQKLPEDRLIDKDEEEVCATKYTNIRYFEESTGATLSLTSSMQLISHYCGHLPQSYEEATESTALYVVKPEGVGMYSCELILPPTSPITHFEGPPMPRKMLAKRAAAYHACVELRKAEYLDEYLLPQYIEKQIPTMANARLAIDISKKHAYEIQRKPNFWKIEDGAPPTQLWLTIFVLEKPHNIREGLPLQPIGMMTRKKLPPKMAPFTLYGDRGLRSDVRLVLLNVPMTITKETLALLDEFTTRVFGDVFNKIFEYSYETQPYWIVPLVNNMVFAEDNTTEECLDWETLRIVFKSNEMEWDASTPGTDFLDRFLVDKVARSRRFAVIEWAKHLGPNDPIPAGSGTAPDSNTIREYSYNEGKKKRMVLPVEADVIEPVFAANRVLHRINYLVPPNEREFSTKLEAHIIPTPFKVTELKMPLVRSLVCFPAMSWKIDAYLQAYDVCTLMDVQMDLKLALEAITKDSDNTHEHDAEAVNQQGGMGTNYERLEFLGDCYLKLGTSISLFCLDPRDDEFHLHVSRMELICNQNLFKNARDINLPRHIQTQGFGRRGWYPAMKLLHGKGSGQGKPKPVERHNLGDKSIADVCEALIGAALVDKGLDGATKMTTNILRADTHTAKEWKDYYKAYTKPDYQTAAPTAQQERLADNIAKQFGYKFKSPRLLMSAFCHPSNPFTYERVPSYQRLEFLGDSLLDLTCVQYIFNNNPTADPQWMTEHKMAMVSNKFLCAVSVELGLHRRLRACGPQIDARICEYALELEEVKSASEGRVDYWVKIESKPPKELADMLEAFIGALFVDTEFDFDIVQHFFDSYIKPYFLDMSLYDDFAGQHPTTFLTKELTRRGCMNWGYEKKNYRDGDNNYVLYGVMIHNEVFEHVVGEAIKDAKVEVSMKALKRLEQMRDVEFEDICDCKQVAEEGAMGDFDWDALLDEEGGDQEEKEE